ncbi:hypothetical protein PAPYR_12075 [Paratrimastix pyriformis]|uniref:Uncharacterized protein n=1 Tax=Paratrimastix pyriformis TaxID=342808 RepID=A0ABQ8U2H4_9EUKA|nr:hypothetical protein PAPYR_12075 [Paratrimastix pyriformis]
MYVDPDPPEVPPLNPNDHEYPPQKQPHAILDSLPFAFSAPFDIHMYVDPDPPKCLRSTPMTTNTPHRSNHTRSLTLCPFAFSAPFDIHMYVDPDPPEVPPLNPNDHEYPSE